MNKERDYLMKRTFPKLKAVAAKRNVIITALDLRWGITEEESKSGKVLEICLKEIDNSIPYFIGLIGNRYGWIPKESDVSVATLERYENVKDYLTSQMSVTEMEMQHGVLSNESEMYASFYINSAQSNDIDEPEKLANLKKEVLENNRYPVYHYSDPKDLADKIEVSLLELLDKLFPEEESSEHEREADAQDAFLTQLCYSYVPHEANFEELDQWLKEGNMPMVLTGESGLGKSALIANWIARLNESPEEQKAYEIIYHFIGNGGSESSSDHISDYLCEEICNRYHFKRDKYYTPEEELQDLLKRITKSQQRPVLFILDALNQVSDINNAKELEWLPKDFGSSMLLTSTTLDDRTLDVMKERTERIFYLQPLSDNKRQELIINYLGRYAKKLTEAQLKRLATAPICRNTLVLKSTLDELVNYGVFEKLDEKIGHYIRPANTEEFYQQLVSSYQEEFGAQLIKDALSAIALSEKGLSEDLLMRILNIEKQYIWSQFFCSFSSHLNTRSGLISFSHQRIAEAVSFFINDRDYANQIRKRIIEALADDLSPQAISEMVFQLYKLEETTVLGEYMNRKEVILHFVHSSSFDDALKFKKVWYYLIENKCKPQIGWRLKDSELDDTLEYASRLAGIGKTGLDSSIIIIQSSLKHRGILGGLFSAFKRSKQMQKISFQFADYYRQSFLSIFIPYCQIAQKESIENYLKGCVSKMKYWIAKYEQMSSILADNSVDKAKAHMDICQNLYDMAIEDVARYPDISETEYRHGRNYEFSRGSFSSMALDECDRALAIYDTTTEDYHRERGEIYKRKADIMKNDFFWTKKMHLVYHGDPRKEVARFLGQTYERTITDMIDCYSAWIDCVQYESESGNFVYGECSEIVSSLEEILATEDNDISNLFPLYERLNSLEKKFGPISYPNTGNIKEITLNSLDFDINMFRDEDVKYSVTIADGITVIPDYTFYFATSIIKIQLPDSLTGIGEAAFSGCEFDRIEIPDSVLSIGPGAFTNCRHLKKIKFPRKVSILEAQVCSRCQRLTEVVLPDGLVEIHSYAFYKDWALNSIEIPSSVSSIEEGVFDECPNLIDVPLSTNNSNERSTWIAPSSPYTAKDGVYSFADGTEIIDSILNDNEDVIEIHIPGSAKSIESYAFSGCKNLQRITIPENVCEIGENALCQCDNLKSVSLPDNIETLPNSLFELCTSLVDVKLPAKLVSIGQCVFSGCSALKSLFLPSGVSRIDNLTFDGCQSLTNIEVSEENTSFYSLDGVLFSRYYSTWDRTGLNDTEESRIVDIPMKTLKSFPCGRIEDDYYVPEKVEVIGDFAFQNATVKKISFPDSLRQIGWCSFADCKKLKEINFPDSLEIIKNSAFCRCKALERIKFPNGIKATGDSAFSDCSELYEVILPPLLEEISKFSFSQCKSLKSILIPDGIKSVKSHAFYSCEGLEEITLPDSISIIEDAVFQECKSLSKIKLSRSLTCISKQLLKDCKSLQKIVINDRVKGIEEEAFANCSSLVEIELPSSVVSIGRMAFSFCTSLKSVGISSEINSIGPNAFMACSSLNEIKIIGEESISPEQLTILQETFPEPYGMVLSVPKGSASMFRSHPYFKQWQNIKEYPLP